MSEQQPISSNTNSSGKIHLNKSPTQHKVNTKKTKKTKKTKNPSSRIIQPGGRANSNRWSEHNSIPNETDETDVNVDFKNKENETVAQQRIPTEDTWHTKLHTITSDETETFW
tara:strand:- start:99 stop:437 length:339 start_codon:yes stop_codon:yes gene_type:complete